MCVKPLLQHIVVPPLEHSKVMYWVSPMHSKHWGYRDVLRIPGAHVPEGNGKGRQTLYFMISSLAMLCIGSLSDQKCWSSNSVWERNGFQEFILKLSQVKKIRIRSRMEKKHSFNREKHTYYACSNFMSSCNR